MTAWPSLLQRKLPGNGGEQVAHVFRRFGRGLEEQEASFPRVGFRVGRSDGPFVGMVRNHIGLVPGQGYDNILVRLALEFFDP